MALSEEPGGPGINLPTVGAVMCSMHGELFRLSWPTGYLTFAMRSVTIVLNEPPGLDVLHEHAGDDASRIDGVLAEFGPLCRLMTSEQRLQAYKDASAVPGWSERGVCAFCSRWKLGARALWRQAGMDGALERHACFECVARLPCQTS